jgi:lipoprotein-releasing system permease protein
MQFVWTVAIRLLREGRFQSLLIVGGVTLGVAVVVYVTAIVNGLQSNIIQKTLSTQPHITIRPLDETNRRSFAGAPGERVMAEVQQRTQREETLRDWSRLVTQAREVSGVRNIAVMASGPGFAVKGGVRKSVALMGVDLADYLKIVQLEDKLLAGRLALPSGSVLIGSELAADYGLKVGDRLHLIGQPDSDDSFTVAGILDFGLKDLNRRWVLLPLRSAQSLLGYKLDITEIYLTVDELFAADRIAEQLAARTGQKVESWIQTNSQLMTALRSQTASTLMIRLFVMIAVAFGIASVLVVSVVQRQREIGILRAMGTPASRIQAIFLLQGGLVGLTGSLLGAVLGGGIAKAFTRLASNTDGSPLFPVNLTPELFLSTAVIAFLVGVLSALAPARRAAKLDPVEAIRG